MDRSTAGLIADRYEHDVAIVGLGPTGATLANLCGQLGLRTVVFERSTAPFPQPRACHLDAEIARVFQQLGFAHQLSELLTISTGMEYVDAAGDRLFTFEGFEREPLLGWHEDYVFVQPEIDRMLRDGLHRFSCVDVRLGAEAPPLDELRETARFVVACDGATSPTRAALGIGLHDLGFDERWLVVDVLVREVPVGDRSLVRDRSLELPTIIQQVCDPARLATFVPSHGRHRRWELHLGDDEVVDADDVWALLAPWGVTADDVDLLRAVPYRFHALVADRWRDGSVLLAGDAAHQMPPFMGQGMCSGIRDAANLAWKLSAVIHGDADDALIDTYESERRPHVEAVTRLSIQAGELLARLAADPAALPTADAPDPTRWSRLPGLDLGEPFPVGHLVPQPERLDDRLAAWTWVAADAGFVAPDDRPVVVEPRATYGCRAVLVRPDRYIGAVAG